MKRILRVFFLIFTFLFVNLLAINVSSVKAEDSDITLDLSNAYRGEIKNYWALVNYGNNFIGDDTITIFLDPEAINNEEIKYILISEYDEYGDIRSTYYQRGIDSNFASRFTYTFISEDYGKKPFTIFLLSDLYTLPFSIIDRIDIDDIEKLRTIEELTRADFDIYSDEYDINARGDDIEWATLPYKVYVDIKNNSCDYKLKSVTYSYTHVDSEGNEKLITGSAIKDEDSGECNRFYFMVSENTVYNIVIEDYFGVVKPNEGEHWQIEIVNLLDSIIRLVAEYDTSLTNGSVYLHVFVFDGRGTQYPGSLITELSVTDEEGNVTDIRNLYLYEATKNGVYTIAVKTEVLESYLEINITNIDKVRPIVYMVDEIQVNSSDVERSPYVFDPINYVLATDDVSSGNELTINLTYYYVSEADITCKTAVGNVLEENLYRYLYSVNNVCMQAEVIDEAGNNSFAITRVEVTDNTKPTISTLIQEIELEIGDDMPTNEELVDMFRVIVDDNSLIFNPERIISVVGDLSNVNLEELGVYEVFMHCIDEAGNISEEISLTVVVTQRILVIDAVPNQYIVYGEEMIEILYTCNGNPCINVDNPQDSEILVADWSKLTGELYIAAGSIYAGEYPIYSTLTINSNKYYINLNNLGVFTIKQRTFKIIANSYSIDYKDEEPTLTWYMDTSVCNPDLSTKYTSFNEINYSCTFVGGDDFGGGTYVYDVIKGTTVYAGAIKREEGITVKYSNNKVTYYKIGLGDLTVKEVSSGGRTNYSIDFYGMDGILTVVEPADWDDEYYNYYYLDEDGIYVSLDSYRVWEEDTYFYKDPNTNQDINSLSRGYAKFYIYPKYVEVTLENVTKIYGEDDPNPHYLDENKGLIKEDGQGHVQYGFVCFSYKEPIKSMCMEGSDTYSLTDLQNEIGMSISRVDGENVGRYKISGHYTNDNYEVFFNEDVSEEYDRVPAPAAYLTIIKRNIEMSIEGENGDGKYKIFYEDALPIVTVRIDTDSSIAHEGLASNTYLNINNGDIISFADRLNYGDHRVAYYDGNTKMDIVIGGYDEYITGVGTFTIKRDTITILNIPGEDVWNNYNVTFNEGELEVFARQIYIKIIEGLNKTYGDNDPIFNDSYVTNKYGEINNLVVDGSGNFILQIINTLDNTTIVDRDDYEPFDKDKLVYHLVRSKDSIGIEENDVHEGEMVGSYLVREDYFENSTNYIIDIYQDYYFNIEKRQIVVDIHDATIEFNYDNFVPKFSYGFSNLAFTDVLIGQPKVREEERYRNNGYYDIVVGNIKPISETPIISSQNNYWYINEENTEISLDDILLLDNSLIEIANGKYVVWDANSNTYIETSIGFKEYSVESNYIVSYKAGTLDVVPREVIVVPDSGVDKIYGNHDPVFTYKVIHYSDYLNNDHTLEVIRDPSDFDGYLSRVEGEKPGLYNITQGNLAPANKGVIHGRNFIIKGFNNSITFEIHKRDLVIRHAASDANNRVEVFYGDNALDSIVSGFSVVSGSEAYNTNLCTYEMVNGVNTCDLIYDTIAGGITTYPENPEDVGTYSIINKDLRLERVISKVNVSEYYNLTFIEATLVILPRIIYITPNENQSKVYGEGGGDSCDITYTFAPTLVKPTDTFSGCLRREAKMSPDGNLTSEDVGEYKITLGDLVIGPNYQLVMNGSVMYQILARSLTITAKVIGDDVVKSGSLNVYTMMYGNDFELGYDLGGGGLVDNPFLGIRDTLINDVKLSPEYDGVGTYLVVQGALTIANNKSRNYHITFERATFVVTKRVINVKPIELSKVYGEKDPNEFPFELTGEEAPYTGKLTRVSGENAGTYKILVGTLYFGPNYDIVLEDVYFEIYKRNVDVIANDANKIYSFEDPELTYNVIVENDFIIDTSWFGKLERESGEEVGTYNITQGTLNLNSNYNINFTGATFTIAYAPFESIVINNITQNQYQTQGSESLVKLEARFNKGADETNLKDVSWSIKKDGKDIVFDTDINNVISFTPSGSAGVYVVTASYNGISATYEVNVRPNNVSNIHITLDPNSYDTQVLGAESELIYRADVDLYNEDYSNVVIEWFIGNARVCEIAVTSSVSYCRFTPNIDVELKVGTYTVYAAIGSITSSNSLKFTLNDNKAPTITLEGDRVVYREAFQNGNKIEFNEPGYTAKDDVDGDITLNVKVEGVDKINYYKTGSYVIIYSVMDKHGHLATNYRTVVVRDTVAPVVSLNNPELSTIILEYGDTYTEYGATGYDLYDAYYGYELDITIDNKVDINKIGEYQVRYLFVDSSGNASEVVRTVIIQDTTKPTITLIGDNTVYLEYLEPFRDAGAWFEDNYDARTRIYATSIEFIDPDTLETSVVSSVDTSILGTYRLTYYKTDSSGNTPVSVPTRTVIVRDSTPPVITLLGGNPFILRYGDKYVDPGYTVIDNYDGDITNNTELVEVREVIGDTLGTYYVYYNAKDSHNNIAATVIREVIILDLVSPIIMFTEACPQYIYLEALVDSYDTKCNRPGTGYTVYDDYTPDIDAIQNWVVVRGTVDNTTIGTYELTYNVSDRSGNNAVTLTRYVVVEDTLKPTITLNPNSEGEVDYYIEVFSEYVEYGYTVSDLYDDYHSLEIEVDISHDIHIDRLNTYRVTYIATDSNGNESDPVYRYITVRDTVPPVVTLIGDEELTIERGKAEYVDRGAQAVDEYDGLITDIYLTNPELPTGMNLGTFYIEYCASDTSGNIGCATRTLHVIDTIAPEVYGVRDGEYYNQSLYIYYAPTYVGTDEVLFGWLNGEVITSPWYVHEEDTYELVVIDDAGNTTTINFVLDKTPPVLYGTNNMMYINHDVNIYSDEVLQSITYKIDNGGYVSEEVQSLLFTNEAEYWVYATDMAGNTSTPIQFVIDKTPPEYALLGVENGGITNKEVSLITENDVVVSVNGEYISTTSTFTENGYYKITIRDKAGNDVFIQFVINNRSTVTISGRNVSYISQHNAINKFIAPGASYPRGVGFIYAKPLLNKTFEYISGTLFSDEEYSKLLEGESLSFDVPKVGEEEMVVAFIVTLDELNKFTTQTVEGDQDSTIIYAMAAIGIALLGGGFFYFFVVVKRKKEEEEEEEEEIIEDDEYY